MRLRQKVVTGVACLVGGLGLLAGLLFNYNSQKKIAVQTAVPVATVDNSESTIAKKVQDISEEKTSYSEYSTFIPGVWQFDVDLGRLPWDSSHLLNWAKRNNLKFEYNPRELKYGVDISECDIYLLNQTPTKKYLVPKNGASFHNFGRVDFELITLETLMNAEYSKEKISISDFENFVYSVIGIKTNSGNYAKFRIDRYVDIERPDSDIEKYDLKCTIGLYQNWDKSKEKKEVF